MTTIKVLGPGCKRCQTTAQMISAAAQAKGVAVEIEKVTDPAAIVGYGVMATPGVIIDGVLVHAGGLPSADQVHEWLDKVQ